MDSHLCGVTAKSGLLKHQMSIHIIINEESDRNCSEKKLLSPINAPSANNVSCKGFAKENLGEHGKRNVAMSKIIDVNMRLSNLNLFFVVSTVSMKLQGSRICNPTDSHIVSHLKLPAHYKTQNATCQLSLRSRRKAPIVVQKSGKKKARFITRGSPGKASNKWGDSKLQSKGVSCTSLSKDQRKKRVRGNIHSECPPWHEEPPEASNLVTPELAPAHEKR